VLLALEAEEARPRDEAPEQEVEEAPEGADDHEGDEHGLPERPVVLPHEERDERRARQQSDERGGAGEAPPAGRELARDLDFVRALELERARIERGVEAGHRLALRCVVCRGSRRRGIRISFLSTVSGPIRFVSDNLGMTS
jgi:hypothetical protein